MLLDEIIFKQLNTISRIKESPKNLDEIYNYFRKLKTGIENNENNSLLIGLVFFKFISDEKIRDRKVTSRVFEDIISNIFMGSTADSISKSNPDTSREILYLDKLCSGLDWKISTDLSGNKREKVDTQFKEYGLSLKTLKGPLYDAELEVIDKKCNKELNIGSLSFRALLIGLIPDDQLASLKDRKGGLGSKKQLIEKIYTPLKTENKWLEFLNRLELYMRYVYSNCDILLAMKSGYIMKLYFIHEEDFINNLIKIGRTDYQTFFDIFYRWENNNLRLHYYKLLKNLDCEGKLKTIELKFNHIFENCSFIEDIKEMENKVKKLVGSLSTGVGGEK